jgi:hypothetical protein
MIDEFVRVLPAHKASLTIHHNNHLDYYVTVEQAIADEDFGYCDWVSDEEKQKAIDTNEAWFIQWYPETPVGFCVMAASTLPALLAGL